MKRIVIGYLLLCFFVGFALTLRAQVQGPGPGTTGTTGSGSGGGSTSPGGGEGSVQYAHSGTFSGFNGTGLLKLNGSGAPTIGVAKTDFAPITTGVANLPLYTDGLGGFTNGTRSGNTTKTVTTIGTLVNGDCSQWDVNGNLVDSGAACGSGGGGSGTVSGAPQYDVPYYTNAGTSTVVGGVAISGIQKDSTSGAPAAAVAGTDYLAPPTGTHIQKANSGGALADAISGTDYAPATPAGTNILKSNNAGGFSTASSGTDYAPATPAGTAILKANNSGGFSSATAGTDYLAPPSGTAIMKANNLGALANAVAGTDYIAPPSGTSILKANNNGALANATAGSDYLAPPSGVAIQKANSGSALTPAIAGTDYVAPFVTSAVLKGDGAGGFTAATAGTDYAVANTFNHTASISNATLSCTNTSGTNPSTDFYQGKLSGANVTYTLPASSVGCIANDMIAIDITQDSTHTVTVTNGTGTVIPNAVCPSLPSGNNSILNEYFTYDLGPATPSWVAHCGGTSPSTLPPLVVYQTVGNPSFTQAAAQSTSYDIFKYTVAGNTLGTTHSLDMWVFGEYDNSTTSDQPTFNITYGGTNLFTGVSNSLASNALGHGIQIHCHLASNGSTGGQTGACHVWAGTAGNQTTGAAMANTWDVISANTAIAIDSTTSQDFKASFNNTASANSTIKVWSGYVTEQ